MAARIREKSPLVDIEFVEFVTTGDTRPDEPLGPHLGQAFFTKEIETALLDGRIDVAVHSCKDLATSLPAGLALGAVPIREDPRDAIVSSAGPLALLPEGARIGTSSPRRRGFLTHAYPRLSFVPQRGNVPTRVEAVESGKLSACVLAVAGLTRLGMADRITEVLEPDVILPAASQGALAVEVRSGDSKTLETVNPLDHPETRAEVIAERACLHRLEAGCQAPVGTLARNRESTITLDAAVVTKERIVRRERSAPLDESEALGIQVAVDLLETLNRSSLRDVGGGSILFR